MNLHAVKTRLPLWGGMLLLPILALGFYLDSQRHTPGIQVRPPLAPAPTPAPAPALRDQLPPAVISRPEAAPLPVAAVELNREPAGVAPEAAREAVFHKENTVYEKATGLFEAEVVDVEWASNYEQSLRDMFASHKGLLRVSVNTISCRTSMCRIEVFTPRDTDADYFTAMFYNALDNFREGTLKAEASIARRMEQGMTSVYIARKGYTLGFY